MQIHDACMYLCAPGHTDERIADARPPHTRAQRAASVRARVRACAIGRPRIRADTCERPGVGVDRMWLGSQALNSASAFNANIGAWNIACVSNMAYVCAAFSARRRAPPWRDAIGGSSMRHGPFCAAASPMRARACVRRRVGTRMYGCTRV
jgi:hypothetical protein